jgi:hypothetical protein
MSHLTNKGYDNLYQQRDGMLATAIFWKKEKYVCMNDWTVPFEKGQGDRGFLVVWLAERNLKIEQ